MQIARTFNRISEEDRDKPDTSIDNQISINTNKADQTEGLQLDKSKPHYIAINEKSWLPLEERKVLWQAYRDAIKKEYQVLIVKDLDRLARGRNLDLILFKFEKAEIKIISCSGETDQKTVLVKSFMGGWYVQDFRDKAIQLQEKKIREGLPIGKAPFGYKNKNKKWAINEKDAMNVRLCFANAFKNKKYTDIISNLRISKDLYYKIIKNPAYIGQIQFTKKIRDPDGKTIEKKIITYQGVHEPIISKEFFYKVNKLP